MGQHGFFHHSGKMTLWGPAMVMLLALPLALIAGNLSAVLIYVFDWIAVKIVILFATIIGLSFAVYGLLRVGRIRNTTFALVVGFLVAILAWTSSWVALAQALIDGHPWLWHPGDLYAFAQTVAEQGRWQKGDQPIPALVTWSVWVIEALMFVSVITVLPWDYLRNSPYCEDCGRWLDANTSVGPFAPGGDPYAIRAEIERGNLSSLLYLGPAQDAPYWELQLRYCGLCENMYLANLVRLTLDDEGEHKRHKLIRNFYISRQQYDTLWDLDKPDKLKGQL